MVGHEKDIDLARENEKLRNKILKLEQELNIEKAKLYGRLFPNDDNYKSLFENAPLPYQMLDERGQIINVNQAWLDLLGYECSDIVGTSIENYLTSESIKLLQNQFPQFIENGQIKSTEFELITKKGDVLQVEVNGRIQNDSNGKFKATHCILSNVTEKKKTESELMSSKTSWETTFNSISDAIALLNTECIVSQCNASYSKLIDQSREAIIGNVCFASANYFKSNQSECPFAKSKKTKKREEMIISIGIRDFNVIIDPIFSNEGEFTGAVHILQDVTEKRASEKLRIQQNEELITLRRQSEENADKYRLIIENQIDLVVKVDAQNRFLYVSPNYCTVFGTSEEELLGNSFMPLVHEDDRDKTNEEMRKLTTSPYTCTIEQRAMTVNGWRWFSWSDKAIVDENNNIISVIGVGHDITERKQLKDSLSKSLIRNNALLSAIPDLMFVINGDGKIIDFRTDINDTNFLDPSIFSSKNVAEILPQDIADSVLKNIIDVLTSFHLSKATYTLDIKGETKYFEARFIYYDKNEVLAIVRDFTDLKRIEDELTQSKQLLKNVLDTIPIRVFWKNKSLKYIGCNRAFLEDTGFSSVDEIVGKTDFDLVWKEQAKFYRDVDNEIIASGIPQIGYEELQDSISIDKQWLRTSKFPLRDEANTIYGVLGLYENITEQKQTELVRKIQHKIASALVTVSSLGDLLEILRVEIHKLVNAENFFVAEYNETTDMLKLLHFKDEIDNIELWSAKVSLSGKVVKEGKSLLVTSADIDKLSEKTGIDYIGKKAASWLGIPLIFEGKVHGVMVVQSYSNTNAYNERDKELLEQVAHQVSIFINQKRSVENAMKLLVGIEQSPVNMFITDNTGHIEYVNKSFCDTTGYQLAEVIGQTPSMLKSNCHEKEVYDNLWQTIMNGEGWSGELYNKKKSGAFYWSNSIISPLKDEKGSITHFIAVSEDITIQKRITEELILAKERAEESDRLKSAFLANISHEIRTPMNAILGFTELLRDQEINPEKSENYLSIIQKSARHLLLIINDIIEISKIETNQISLYFKEINLYDCVANLVKTVEITIPSNKNIHFTFIHPDVKLSTKIITDELKFSQVILNLLTNAVKYTEKGKISIHYEVENNNLKFIVADTGIGIDKKYQELIFNRFNRLESKLSTKAGGSGLGLAIAKAYIELLDGTIGVESEVGVGSTFTFIIPLKSDITIKSVRKGVS